MIVERLTFRAKYGQGDSLEALLRDVPTHMANNGHPMRIYTDLTGPMFTLQVEQEYEDLTSYTSEQQSMVEMFGGEDFQRWFDKMQPLVETGERQLLNVDVVA